MIRKISDIINRSQHIDRLLLFLILAIGALLRFYRLSDIPFTHDEFSAIIRTQYDTFGELIDKGVKIDGHPAGVQVFLYYLIRIFGVSEAILKTPFILFGLLSVWLVYLIGKSWFNATVGLVAASFVSFLQFPVMYSQIARPYASGLLFALMMVWFWTSIVFHPKRHYYLNIFGYVISGALCAYNHHFSMLFALMVGVTGLFYCSRANLKSYIAAGLLVFVLYIPHLPVLFYQLGTGGVEGWLQKPRYDFIFDYLKYIFHFSVFVFLLVFLLISLSMLWYEREPRVNRKFILISVIWFLLPYLIGFFYSKYRSAVLQYSVLIFSFPFLLFILFGYFKTARAMHKVILVTLIALVVTTSLVVERRHYQLFYKAPYREIVAESKRAVDSLGAANCQVILDTKQEINPYYLKKLNCPDLSFRYFDSIGTRGKLLTYLDSCKGNYLAFGCISSTPWENYSLMIERFPFLVRHACYAGGDFYLFSRMNPIYQENGLDSIFSTDSPDYKSGKNNQHFPLNRIDHLANQKDLQAIQKDLQAIQNDLLANQNDHQANQNDHQANRNVHQSNLNNRRFFNTDSEIRSSEYFYEVVNNFEPSLPEWGWIDQKRCIDSLSIEGNLSFASPAGSEFSPTYSKSLRDLMRSPNDVIDVSVDMRTPLVFPGAWLVISVTSNGKDIKWSSTAVNDYIKPGNQGRVFHSLRLSDIELRHHGLMFHAFIWNPMKSPYILDHFRVRVRTGNPVIYGLYRKVD